MGFADLRARVSGAVHDRLGDGATWNGTPLKVRPKKMDGLMDLGDAQIIAGSVIIKVLKSVVPDPAAGDVVVIDGETFHLLDDAAPVLNVRGEWECQARKG